MLNHRFTKLSSNRGFTLVEMLIVAPIVILVIGVFISALVAMTGDVLVVRGSNALSYNIQDALNRIDLDVKTSGGYLATNDITLTSPQGFNNDTTVFHNADATNGTMLIIKAFATTKNPIDPTKSYVYQSNQPKACNDQLVSQNSIVLFDIVYFVKSVNGVNSLWRRVVAPSNYTTAGCSVPWQQPTCASGYVAAFCKANDVKLVDGITSFGVNYYTSSDTVNPIANATDTGLVDSVRQTAIETASTVGITINATKKLAGRDIGKSGTIRAVSPSPYVAAPVTIDPVYGSGSDGAITVASGKNINTDTLATGRTCADAVNYSVTALTANSATLSTTPAAGCLVAGDEMLLINLQGISANFANVGNRETLRILSISTNTITFTANKSKYYGNGASDDTNIGTAITNQRVMLQRVPNYTNVTINSAITLSAAAWDGTKNGVLAFRANGTLTNIGNISMVGSGYLNGVGGANGCTNYPWPTTAGDHGASYNGDNSISACNRKADVVGNKIAVAVNAGGGGGGAGTTVTARNGGGGGGGGYGTAGGTGSSSTSGEAGGGSGGTNGNANLVVIYPGSGGGGGGRGVNATGGNAGKGGGIILISATTISNSGSISASGSSGSNGVASDDGGGGAGGGSGGSVVLQGATLTIGSNIVVSGGGANGTGSTGAYGTGGNGGAGGSGRIAIYSPNSISGTTLPAYALLSGWYF